MTFDSKNMITVQIAMFLVKIWTFLIARTKNTSLPSYICA